jgi:hypothetical protein
MLISCACRSTTLGADWTIPHLAALQCLDNGSTALQARRAPGLHQSPRHREGSKTPKPSPFAPDQRTPAAQAAA